MIRAIVADDAVLFREGLARLLTDSGIDVVAQVGDPLALRAAVDRLEPDLAVIDVRMPPTHTTEGLAEAVRIRRRRPATTVLILSQYVEAQDAVELLGDDPAGVGYLLKQRVTDISAFVATVRHVAAGGTFIDPEVATLLVDRRRRIGLLSELSEREIEVLQLMAEGRSNQGIIDRLVLSSRTVESHVRSIFHKLGLIAQPDDHRRVLAVITYLRTLDQG
jgi:DNA-binding NarL/FixJ family response regulator